MHIAHHHSFAHTPITFSDLPVLDDEFDTLGVENVSFDSSKSPSYFSRRVF